MFELSSQSWKLGFATELGQRIRECAVPAWDLGGFELELKKARERLGLEPSARVVSCYEAGREGFSLARYLEASGIENVVVDAGSLEVKRRRRRAKTDRLDLATSMNRLIRWQRGERGVWSVVQVPSVEQVRRLMQLRGIGENGSWLLVHEFFAWPAWCRRRTAAVRWIENGGSAKPGTVGCAR